MTIADTIFPALVDTGATVSAMSSSSYDKLRLKFPNMDTTQGIAFSSADGSNFKSLGTIIVDGHVGNKHIQAQFHVVPNLLHSVILGLPELKSLNAIINMASNSITIGKTSFNMPNRSSKPIPVLATIKQSIPAASHTWLTVQGPNECLSFVETTLHQQKDFTPIASGLVQFNSLGLATIKIANFSNQNVTIFPKQPVANAEILPHISEIKEATSQSLTVKEYNCPPVSILHKDIPSLSDEQFKNLLELLNKYRQCFHIPDKLPVTHLVSHRIDTKHSLPISVPLRRRSQPENDDISKLVDDMLQQGVIQPSHSPWSSPVVIVKKKDGSPRFCIDYRKLNSITTRDVYPLPRIDETTHAVGGSKFFTSLDLKSAYWQIPLHSDSQPKSAFICKKGLFEFTRLPFGLSNAPATLQRLMDTILGGLKWQSCLIYLDDIIIFSADFHSHLHDIGKVLARLQNANLHVNLDKCKFAASELTYLGFIISSEGLRPDTTKLQIIKSWPVPRSTKEVHSFIGLAGYLRSFISNFSARAAPLTKLLRSDVVFHWHHEQQQAFDDLKQCLCQPPVLRFPLPDVQFEIHTDGACTAGIGAILGQRDKTNNKFYAVEYASRSLSPAEKNYSVSDLEALAVKWAVENLMHTSEPLISKLSQTTSVSSGYSKLKVSADVSLDGH